MSDQPLNPIADLYTERAIQSGALLPGFVASAILLAARADPTRPEGTRWDSYVIRGGIATSLALAAQLVIDLPSYLIDGPQHMETVGHIRGFEGTTLPANAIEVLAVHLSKGLNGAWGQLQEVFSRVIIVGAIVDARVVFTFFRIWQPADVPDAKSMGAVAIFSDWAIANLLAKSAKPHFENSIARRVFEGLPGALDARNGE